MSKPTQAYIYQITCIVTDECYVGSTSTQLASRLRKHYWDLRTGNHASVKLQEAWNRHGERAFRDKVLERCPHEDRYVREQWYLDNLLPALNSSSTAAGHPQEEPTKKKIGRAAREWWKTHEQTPAQRAETIVSLGLARAMSRANKPGWIPTHRIGVKDSKATIEKRRQSRLKTEATRARRCWITDGMTEYQIEAASVIPAGWRRGRQPKIGAIGKSRVGEKRSKAARAKMKRAHKGIKLSDAHRAAQKMGWIKRREQAP